MSIMLKNLHSYVYDWIYHKANLGFPSCHSSTALTTFAWCTRNAFISPWKPVSIRMLFDSAIVWGVFFFFFVRFFVVAVFVFVWVFLIHSRGDNICSFLSLVRGTVIHNLTFSVLHILNFCIPCVQAHSPSPACWPQVWEPLIQN